MRHPTSGPTYDTSNRITGLNYDASGNLLGDGSHTYTYDGANELLTVDSGSAATYSYDYENRRTRKVAGGLTTDYLYDLSGHILTEVQGTTFVAGHVYFNGKLLAEYENAGTYFVHPDHLGSTRLLTSYSTTSDLNAQECEVLDYLPFGEQTAAVANYLLESDAFDQAPWTNFDSGTPTITANATTAPDGSTTADKIVFPSGAYSRRVQDFHSNVPGGAAGKTVTYSIWIRADAPVTVRFDLEDRVSGAYDHTSAIVNVTTSWQQFSVTRTIRTGIDAAWAEIGNHYDDTVTTTLYVWGAQVSGLTLGCDPIDKFTSQQYDSESGNDYFNARYFSSAQGRFLSSDPAGNLVADPSDPQSWNQYAYVRNNPTNMIDPTGLDGIPDCGPVCWIISGIFDLFGLFGGGGHATLPPRKTLPKLSGPDPFSGSAIGDSNGMDIGDPTAGEVDGIPTNMWGSVIFGGAPGWSMTGCSYGQGNCGGGIYGFGATPYQWATCTQNNRLDNALRRLGEAYGHPTLGKIAAGLTLGALAEPVADFSFGEKVPALLGRTAHSSTWLRRVGFAKAGRVVSTIAAGAVLFEGAYDAEVMFRCAITPSSLP